MSHVMGPGERSEATRYLCAAGYLDEDFRRLSVDELLFNPLRAVAPSYGIDVVPVLTHCLQAQRWALLRDAVITGIWILGLFIAPPIAWSAILYGIPAWWLYRRMRNTSAGRVARLAVPRLGCLGLAAVGLVAVAGMLGLYLLAKSVPELLTQLLFAPALVLAGLLLIGLLPAVFVVVVFVHRLAVHREIVDALQPAVFAETTDPRAPDWARPRLAQIEEAQHGNVVYVAASRAEEPFVGGGTVIEYSSFAIPLRPRAGGQQQTVPISAEGLYERLRTAITALAHPDTATENRVRGLTLRDRLYVAGRLRPDSPYLVAGSPTPRVGPDMVATVTADERGTTRRFLVARVAGWHGELETSVFFDVSVRGDMLYVEYTATLLPPVADRFHAIDGYEHLTGPVVLRQLGSSVLDLLRVVPGAPLRLCRFGVGTLERRRRMRVAAGHAQRRLSYDYGSRFGLREIGAAEPGWFASTDSHEVRTLLIRRAFATIADSLSDLGYDTSEFDNRANVVINNSTTNLGGATIHSSVIASGSSSRAGQAPSTGRTDS